MVDEAEWRRNTDVNLEWVIQTFQTRAEADVRLGSFLTLR